MDERNLKGYLDRLEKEFKSFEGRFDHHLDIYARNGKELAKLTYHVQISNKLTEELRDDVKQVKLWKAYVTGAIGVLILIFLPLLFWSMTQIFELSRQSDTLEEKVSALKEKGE